MGLRRAVFDVLLRNAVHVRDPGIGVFRQDSDLVAEFVPRDDSVGNLTVVALSSLCETCARDTQWGGFHCCCEPGLSTRLLLSVHYDVHDLAVDDESPVPATSIGSADDGASLGGLSKAHLMGDRDSCLVHLPSTFKQEFADSSPLESLVTGAVRMCTAPLRKGESAIEADWVPWQVSIEDGAVSVATTMLQNYARTKRARRKGHEPEIIGCEYFDVIAPGSRTGNATLRVFSRLFGRSGYPDLVSRFVGADSAITRSVVSELKTSGSGLAPDVKYQLIGYCDALAVDSSQSAYRNAYAMVMEPNAAYFLILRRQETGSGWVTHVQWSDAVVGIPNDRNFIRNLMRARAKQLFDAVVDKEICDYVVKSGRDDGGTPNG